MNEIIIKEDMQVFLVRMKKTKYYLFLGMEITVPKNN